MLPDDTQKKCVVCAVPKGKGAFAKRPGSPDGSRNTCKTCDASYQETYRARHKDLLREYAGTYREEHKEEQRLRREKAQQWCVYQATFSDGYFYIGSAINFNLRVNMHKSLSRRGVSSPTLNGRDFTAASMAITKCPDEMAAKRLEREMVRSAKASTALCLNIKLPDNTGREYWVYVIQSSQKRYGKGQTELPGICYVGMTTDPARRLKQHNGEKVGGGKYTSAHRPWEARALFGPYATRSDALKAEHTLKRKHRGVRRFYWTPEDSSWCCGEGVNHPWVSDPVGWQPPNQITNRQAAKR